MKVSHSCLDEARPSHHASLYVQWDIDIDKDNMDGRFVTMKDEFLKTIWYTLVQIILEDCGHITVMPAANLAWQEFIYSC